MDPVTCGICDTDLSGDTRSGGFVLGRHLYGPCCAAAGLEAYRRVGEGRRIVHCPPSMTFADWIRGLRRLGALEVNRPAA